MKRTSDDAKTQFDAAQACAGRGDLTGAAEHYRQVLKILPGHAPSHTNLGNVYKALGKLRLAEISYRRAIEASPDYALAHFNLGIILHGRGELAAAEASYRRCLGLEPTSAPAHFALGIVHGQRGEGERAKACYRRAIEIDPHHAAALQNLGNLLKESGELNEAEALYRRALRLSPSDVDLHNNLGSLLYERGDLAGAAAAYERVLQLDPGHVRALANMGTVQRERGRPTEALALYRRAVHLDPAYAPAWHQMGRILMRLDRLDEAIAAYRRVLALRPDSGAALAGLVSARQMACDWHGIEAEQQRLIASVRSGNPDVAPMILITQPCDAADHQICARQRSRVLAKSVRPLPPRRPARGPRLRIGYLSADFHEHATAYLAAELFERHDRSQLEVTGYSYGPDDGSAMRARLKAAFDRFSDMAALPHDLAARRIREDAIDILVDLKGHCNDGRPQILAFRPAPIQVNFLGYAGTMGAAFVDYIIADPFVVPLDQQEFYDECVVQLPHCYQPNDTRRAIGGKPQRRGDWGLPDNAFLFCCFNSPHKIGIEIFEIWMRLLAAVPKSALWLIDGNGMAGANLRREAAVRGIDPSRLVFAPKVPSADHLARHRLADLFLDTLPYNAHTTASDALWAGLPVLTCAGRTFPARVAGSLLTAIGLPELITSSLRDYEQRALALARDPGALAELRQKLLRHRETAPLFDIGLYTRHLEAAYRRMYETSQKGEKPVPFAVAEVMKAAPGRTRPLSS